ncbi:S-layer homology domain-containing protein [Paenibacillus hexagrammi]|uniref:S-layer homology domain-containing protein n=1 Tax=Paenibacillus hexagrammi TaxID=2908839 RepID=A0ABY3SKF3_9BACL|nr:S-layer homology domain-containing protein [Paenibacillus sp. YPD9-1]UJF34523.1 S-layer homology domain-containing protein [Paenibacillus sp. YPD9-1]
MFIYKKLIRPLRCLPVVLLTLAAVVSSGPTEVLAAPASPVHVTFGTVSAKKGDHMRIPVSMSKPPAGIGSYGIQVDFDPTKFEVVSITPSYGSTDATTCHEADQGCFASNIDQTNGWIRAIWADASGGDKPLTEAQELFVIEAIPKQTGENTFSVQVTDPENLNFTDKDMHALPVDVSAGKITASNRPSATPVVATGSVNIVVNGQKQENSATMTKTKVNDRTVVSLNVDEAKVTQQLNNKQLKTLLLPVTEDSDEVVGELNGKLVKTMEGQEATLEIRTNRASYTLPAAQINIDKISSTFGKETSLQDIKINVSIAETTEDKKKQAESAAADGGMSISVPPVDFTVKAQYGDHTVDVDRFNSYVERSIALPDGVDPSKMTTGVVVDDNGSLTHIPTKITQVDGKYYATINSLTNSTYTVVWHPKTFVDTKNYWAGKEINDLASRLVVQGVTGDSFAPERAITRAEFTAIVLRSLGLHEGKDNTVFSFNDVKDNDWYRHDVQTAASYGLIGGYADGSFQPNASITRAEAMVILSRASALAKLDTASSGEVDQLLRTFEDNASVGDWARSAVASAIKQGITQGTGGKLEPAQPITRAQTAVMVRRMLVKAALINE